MNNVDKQYLGLLKDILENGTEKDTRAGRVKSVFGRMMRFNLKEGFPLLTTKKIFTKGIIHELLWFLKGDTNIKYLADNNVHIWDDDAYRFYCETIKKNNETLDILPKHPEWYNDYKQKLEILSKEEWYQGVLEGRKLHVVIDEKSYLMSYTPNTWAYEYIFGDLGPVYGKQWRNQFGKDQIQNIIDTLKTNPDDRRMLCVAWNNCDIDKMALPPCHTMMQFYTRELSIHERFDWLWRNSDIKYDDITLELLEKNNVPKRELSCSYNMRSNDWCCGQPFNAASYALLTHMIAEVCNMTVGELVYFGGDVHVYCNHIEQAKEQLLRQGNDKLPKLRFARKINNIDDFTFDDIIIEDYYPEPPIKYQLNVG